MPSEVHLKPVLMRYNFSKQNCNAIRWSVLDVGGRALCISGKSAASGSLFYETLLLMWHQGEICDFSLDLTHLWKQTDGQFTLISKGMVK